MSLKNSTQTLVPFGIVVLCTSLLVKTDGLVIAAFAPMILYSVVLLAPLARLSQIYKIFLVYVFFMFTLDNAEYAFNEYKPFTQIIGLNSLFSGLLPVIGMDETIFGTLFLLTAFHVLMLHKAPWSFPDIHLPKECMAILFATAMVLLYSVSGLGTGGSIQIAAVQSKWAIFLPLSILFGFILMTSEQKLINMFWVLSAATILKSLQGIYVFLVPYGADMGTREFLIDHYTSDFIATTATFLILLYATSKSRLRLKILYLVPILPMLMAYLLNDRRASLAGVILSLLLLCSAFPFSSIKRFLPKIASAVLLFSAYIAATWNTEGLISIPAKSIKTIIASDAPPGGVDYRKLENYNNYLSISNSPLTGIGYGNPIPFPHQSFDWSTLFQYFNITPHNSLLSTWSLGGPFTLAGLGLFVTSCIALATRVMAKPQSRKMFILAALAFTMVIRWMLYVIADLGLGEFRCQLVLCVGVGGIARLVWEYSKIENINSLPRIH